MKRNLAFAIVAILLVAGGVYIYQNATAPQSPPSSFLSSDYKNGSYIVAGKEITLNNGYAEIPSTSGSASKLITKYFGNEAAGDLNGDGIEDKAFLITQDGGGSGTFFYVVAALKTPDGRFRGTNAVLLGDRIAPQTTEIRDKKIIVNFAERKPGEPITAQPSVGVSKYLKIENGMLVEASKGGVACTQEALLCPSSSYVSRHGVECGFNKCPNNAPFIGKLEQKSGGFWLITESPDKNSQEVSYAMKLEIKITNVLSQFVGKKVKVFGNFTEGNTFQVDRLEGAGDLTLGEVGSGKTVYINGVLVTLNKIIEDSRCPVGVKCIQAGSVTANLTLKSDTDK